MIPPNQVKIAPCLVQADTGFFVAGSDTSVNSITSACKVQTTLVFGETEVLEITPSSGPGPAVGWGIPPHPSILFVRIETVGRGPLHFHGLQFKDEPRAVSTVTPKTVDKKKQRACYAALSKTQDGGITKGKYGRSGRILKTTPRFQ